MQAISRNKLVNYVRASIDDVKETTTRPWHKHEWQKKQSADFIAENEAFIDKFESRPGEVNDILKASEAKMKRRSFLSGAAAVAGLGLTVASAVVGGAVVGGAAIAGGLFIAANALWIGGVASANLVNRGEEKFHGKLEAFKSDIEQEKSPGISSGRHRVSGGGSRSDDDDDFMELGINSRGQVGFKIAPGMQMGLDGKAQFGL